MALGLRWWMKLFLNVWRRSSNFREPVGEDGLKVGKRRFYFVAEWIRFEGMTRWCFNGSQIDVLCEWIHYVRFMLKVSTSLSRERKLFEQSRLTNPKVIKLILIVKRGRKCYVFHLYPLSLEHLYSRTTFSLSLPVIYFQLLYQY